MVYNLVTRIAFYNSFAGVFSITPVYLDKVINMEISYSINSLTNTATITIPRKSAIVISNIDGGKNLGMYYYTDNNYSKNRIIIGAKVEIKYDYNTLSDVKFYGFLTDIKIEENYITLTIEDSMYQLKKSKRIQKTYSSNTLSYIVCDIINTSLLKSVVTLTEDDKTNIELINTSLDGLFSLNYDSTFTFNYTELRVKDLLTPSEIFNMLAEEYGMFFYFIDKVLYFGKKYKDTPKTFGFMYPYNKTSQLNPIITKEIDTRNSDLETSIVLVSSYTTDVIKNNVYAIWDSITSTVDVKEYGEGKTIVDYPEKDNTIELKIPNLSLSECKTLAENTFNNIDNNSIAGSFTTFGKPYMKLGDKIRLTLSDLNQSYTYDILIDGIDVVYGENGFKQTITLGNQLTF